MAKQMLTISPKKRIVFRGPYNRTCTTLVVLQNPIDTPIGFRCRTLEPRMYVVKPSKGILKPKESLTLTIKLKRIKDLDNFDVKQQKFLIQSVASSRQNASFSQMFDQTTLIATSKLKASFEFLDDYRRELNGEKPASKVRFKTGSKIKSISKSESLSNKKSYRSTRSNVSSKDEEITDQTDKETAKKMPLNPSTTTTSRTSKPPTRKMNFTTSSTSKKKNGKKKKSICCCTMH